MGVILFTLEWVRAGYYGGAGVEMRNGCCKLNKPIEKGGIFHETVFVFPVYLLPQWLVRTVKYKKTVRPIEG